MDFKLGTWEITSQVGHVFGIQSFEKILDGCAIKETYIATDGSRKGSSIIFYDPEDKLWKQTFADNQGDWTESTGKIVNGKLHFKGKSSRFPMIRWTIEMVSNDQLNWLTEISYDGHHWEILGNNTLNRTEEQR